MWPMLLDMSRDECKRILRRLELEAYASIITAFRAQGALTKEKKNILKDIASELNISMERHRAEVRRAVNDEKLATIAEHMAGPDTGTEWAIVGRRLVPLMPRLVPQTAFTVLANNVANLTAAGNARLPVPSATAKLPGLGPESSAWEPSLAEGSRVPNCPAQPHQSHAGAEQSVGTSSSPNNSPSAIPDVHIKRELEDDGEDTGNKCISKRMRTTSAGESDTASSSSMVTSLSQSRPVSTISSTLASSKILGTCIVPATTSQSAVATSSGVTSTASRLVTVSTPPVPVKITLTSTSTWSTPTTSTTSSGSTQKVIIVSSSGPCGSPSILQRSLSVPMVKTVSSAQSPSSTSSSVSSSGSTSISSALSRGPTSYIINSNSGQVSSQSGTVVTISTGSASESTGGSTRNNSDGNVNATSGSSGAASSSAVSILGSGSAGSGTSTTSGSMIHKIRPKPQSVSIGGISRPRTGPIVIPVTPNTHHPLHQSLACGGTSGITLQQQKSKSLLGVHTVKQEVTGCTVSALGKTQSGMKILPISGVASGGSSMAKILPKPAKGSSLYVVNANSSNTTAASQMSVVSRVVPTSVLSSSPNLNLSTSSVSVLGTRTITSGSGNRINLSTTAVARSVNSPSVLPVSSSGSSTQHPNTTSGGTAVLLHQTGRTAPATASSSNVSVTSISTSASALPLSSTTVSSMGGGSGKSNVIVVQKGPSGNTTFCRGVSLGTTTKELVGKVLKGKAINSSSMTAITVQRRPANAASSTVSVCSNATSNKNGTGLNLSSSNSQGNVIVLDLSNEQIGGNSILNELLQGSGIYAESSGISANCANTNSAEENSKIADMSRLSPPTPDSSDDVQINAAVESSSASMLNVPQTRVVTLEEAVELFGASVGDDGQILLGKKASIFEDSRQTVPVSTMSAKSTDSEGQGTFNEVSPVEAEVAKKETELLEDKKLIEPNVFIPEISKEESSCTNKLESKPMDIFSTAIASAEINLDSIQYMDEDTEEEVGGFAVTIEPAPFDAAEI